MMLYLVCPYMDQTLSFQPGTLQSEYVMMVTVSHRPTNTDPDHNVHFVQKSIVFLTFLHGAAVRAQFIHNGEETSTARAL